MDCSTSPASLVVYSNALNKESPIRRCFQELSRGPIRASFILCNLPYRLDAGNGLEYFADLLLGEVGREVEPDQLPSHALRRPEFADDGRSAATALRGRRRGAGPHARGRHRHHLGDGKSQRRMKRDGKATHSAWNDE
jgi:hypothetical protein